MKPTTMEDLLIKKVSYDDEVMRHINFFIPKICVDMIDELACLDTEGNRTQMFIKLIEKQYRIKKDFQQWKSDDEIRRNIRDSFEKKEYENGKSNCRE